MKRTYGKRIVEISALLAAASLLISQNTAFATPAFSQSIQGWAVLICGGVQGWGEQEDFENQIAEAYNVLLGRGYTADHIYYLDQIYPRDVTGDEVNDVDAAGSKANVQTAITGWLANHSDSNDLCFVYFVDHGYTDAFTCGGTGTLIQSWELNNWLSTVSYGKMIFVMEACFSGSFITGSADSVSGPNRVVITSTDESHYAYSEPGMDWPAFSHAFFPQLGNMSSLGDAFNVAYSHVLEVRPGVQYPWMDDNGDHSGHCGSVPNGGDGNLALSMCWMPGDCNEDNMIDGADLQIVQAAYGSSPPSPNWDPRADVNDDWIANGTDMAIVQAAYGSRPGDPNWNPQADCDGNGIVNMLDLWIVAKANGSHAHPNWDARADLIADLIIDNNDLQIVQMNQGYSP